MNLPILIVTHLKDIRWLEYNLGSIKKYARGFSEVMVLVPLQEFDHFMYLEKKFSRPETPVWIKTFLEHPGKGMCHHMAMICYADIYCPDADLILHSDADCIFTQPVTPDDYVKGDKPDLLYKPFSAILAAKHPSYMWKERVENALGFECEVEAMQRHPAVHYPWLYRITRETIEERHRIPFIDYVIRQENSFPQGFCEFDTLGAVAWRHFKDHYNWIENHATEHSPDEKLQQEWSHWLRHDPAKADEIFKSLEKHVN